MSIVCGLLLETDLVFPFLPYTTDKSSRMLSQFCKFLQTIAIFVNSNTRTMIFRTLLVTTLLALLTITSQAQEDKYIFRILESGNGLLDNNVRNITMLPDGQMCIHTSSMLNLYDGASCRSYKYNASEVPYTEYTGMNNACYDSRENLIWLMTRDDFWTFDMRTKQFEYEIGRKLESYGVKDSDIQNLLIDSNGDYWFCSHRGRIWHYSPEASSTDSFNLPEGMGLPVTMREYNGHIWFSSLNGFLACYDSSLGSFTTVRHFSDCLPEPSSRIEMDVTRSGNLWIMFDKILLHYSTIEDKFKTVRQMPPDTKDLFTTIALDRDDNLWVGTARSGASRISQDGEKMETLPYLQLINGKRIYHHTDISKIYTDYNGGVWIATLSEGLIYWHKDIFRFRNIDNSSLSSGNMNDESVKCMALGRNGKVLVGTIHGLLEYDTATERMTVPYPLLRDELCISLYVDRKGRIWVGTFYNGAYCIHPDGGIRHYKYDGLPVDISYHESTPNFNCVRTFFEGDDGSFWISVYGGVGRFNPETGEIKLLRERHPELRRFMIIRDICDRKDGYLLISGDNGRFLYSPSEDRVVTDPQSEECHAQTNQAIVDGKGLLWMATSDGLRVSELNGDRVWTLDSQTGMPEGNIMSITEDVLGNIWAASFNSISRVKVSRSSEGEMNFAISNFDATDGVRSGAFFHKSSIRLADGRILIGGAHGICEVNPERLYQERYSRKPLISSVTVAGQNRDFADGLTLDYDEPFLTFEFSNLNYQNPSHTSYRYRLGNLDKDWHLLNSTPLGKVQYTFLKPGIYTFMVQAANNGLDWGEVSSVSITIKPPFYMSTAAYIIYTILVCFAGSLFIWLGERRTKQKIRLNKEQERRKRKEELDQMKFRFFTNISHELRTPLSLILLPLESVMKEMKDSDVMPKLETMHKNAQQLLSLVNHLLDFRRLEMGGEKLVLARGNIVEFTSAIIDSFRDAATKKGICLSFENEMSNPTMTFDKSQMQKILNNLLSNALKFTPKGGSIHVSLHQRAENRMVLEVADTGVGIPEKDVEKIFDRFYRSGNSQMETGTGIGLSLVRQYARMHSGDIRVTSQVGRGSTFHLEIPTNLNETEVSEQNVSEDTSITPASSLNGERRHILIVDDNKDFRDYLVGELSGEFEVSSAKDGVQCLEILKSSDPDVVVCDVMMPNMDGFEVTKAIKGNIETSHIPVILLSARTSEDIRLEGYETGADAYLTKPFKLELLLARIRNLIDERSKRIASFSGDRDISLKEVTITTIDQKLMTKVMECIERNIDNSEYSVEELSSDVGMHRMNLYRKIQSIAGMTPSEFIRTVRLKRAAQILKNDPNLTVAEVSDMVGFNTSKYFSKYFKEMFGVNPSQYH